MNENIVGFLNKEGFLTLTVLGSIFTFAFVSSLKGDIVDPLLHMIMPEDFFGYMNITLREGDKPPPIIRNVELRIGNFFREFVTWLFVVAVLYLLAKFTRFPDNPKGTGGVAIA